MNINVLCNKPEQLRAALEMPQISRIYIEADMYKSKAEKEDLIGRVHAAQKECAAALPYIFRDTTYVDVTGFDCVLVRSLDELECYKDYKLISDYGLYAMNAKAAGWLEGHNITQITVPVELNENELYDLGCSGKEIIVYGHIPMMVSAQCIHKNTEGCDRKPKITELTDRTGKVMKVENKCAYCCNLIYNALPLSLIGIMQKVKKLSPSSIRVNLTTEDYEKASAVLLAAIQSVETEVTEPVKDFTRGHFTRGAL